MAFVSSMPKIELHAHLNGSVSEETLGLLIEDKPADSKAQFQSLHTNIADGHNRTLKECFDMFKLVHSIVNDHQSLYQITCAVIEDFANDGVVYLELRSTPRAVAETGITQASYVQTVLRAISDKTATFEQLAKYDASKKPIVVRYIAAIDRSNTVEHAMETVDVAIEYMKKTGLVVGIDLSGDCAVGDARNFIPVLEKAVSNGLKLALHLAEVDGLAEETDRMLDLPPDRIGHGTFIHPEYGGTQQLLEKTRKLNIPLELCLTSNVKAQVTPTADAHHFGSWYQLQHPVVICTDDKGVFATKLTEEYQYLLDTFKLSQEDVMDLAYKSINYVFESDSAKDVLRLYFNQWTDSQK